MGNNTDYEPVSNVTAFEATFNSTCESVKVNELAVFIWILSFLTVLANITLIIVILKTKGLRKQKFNLFMISLAITDLLVGLVVAPFNPLRTKGTWIYGWAWCKIYLSLNIYLLTASIYNFVGVNMDRLFAIKLPLKYKAMQDNRWSVKLVIFVCWTVALISAAPIWWDQTVFFENRGGGCTCNFPYSNVIWVYLSSVFSFILPTVMIVMIWSVILHHFWGTRNTAAVDAANSRKARERRVTIVMGVITVMFLVCVWPFATVFIIGPARMFEFFDSDKTFVIRLLKGIVVFMYSSSLINPLLYIAINRQVRHAIVSLFTGREVDHRQFSVADDSDEKESWQKSISRSLSRQASKFSRTMSVDQK